MVDEANRLAKVDVAGVRRNVNIGLLDEDVRRAACSSAWARSTSRSSRS
jgi:hydrogenase maturation factor